MMRSTARAAPNFALVKYWGKADDEAMIPAVPSLSITLDGPEIEVSVEPAGSDAGADVVSLDGAAVPRPWRDRTKRFLDLVRSRSEQTGRAAVEARGGPPPAAGLASSAAYFAALAQASSRAFGLPLDQESVSDLARMGSVSAARSVPGGIVVLDPADARDGRLGAHSIFPPTHLGLAVIVAVVDPSMKQVGSSEGMKLTRDTSPYYEAWTACAREDLERAREALTSGDLAALGRIAETNCMRMHASSMAADPPLVYLAPATLAAIEKVRTLRRDGLSCFFTVDAGPQVKVVCPGKDVESVRDGMKGVAGVQDVLVQRPGPGSLFSPDRQV
jgi:diphosphomevalonate decarboxylase